MRVEAPAREQLLMRADFDDLPFVQADDPVAMPDRLQAMGDDDHRAPLDDLEHVLLDEALALVVERARGLVEDEDRRVDRQRARDGDALALAAGEIDAALLDERVIAVAQAADELVGAGEARHGDDLRAAHAGIGERDVLVQGAVEQQIFLQHDADLRAQPGGVDLRDVHAVDEHLPCLRDVEALDELRERRLAGAGPPHDSDDLTGPDRERDVLDRLRRAGLVAEGDAAKLDRALGGRQIAMREIERLGRHVEDVA